MLDCALNKPLSVSANILSSDINGGPKEDLILYILSSNKFIIKQSTLTKTLFQNICKKKKKSISNIFLIQNKTILISGTSFLILKSKIFLTYISSFPYLELLAV